MGRTTFLGLALNKKARILVASKSKVYVDPLVRPQSEVNWGNVNLIVPHRVCDEAKRFIQAMSMPYHVYHGLETRIVCIFNTYGHGMR